VHLVMSTSLSYKFVVFTVTVSIVLPCVPFDTEIKSSV